MRLSAAEPQQHWLMQHVMLPVLTLEEDCAVWLAPEDQQVVGAADEAAMRLGIYRHGYFARLTECLADDYSALQAALGKSSFEALCLAFIAAHPSLSPSLNYYGAPFADFCAQQATPWSTFARDLARLEWAVVQAVHAEATIGLSNSELLALGDWNDLRLVPNPSLQLLFFEYPVGRYYQTFLETPEEDSQPESVPAIAASWIAVCRSADQIWRVHLTSTLATLLQRLIDGEPLGVAIESELGSGRSDLTADLLQSAFANWMSCNFFSAVIATDRAIA